MLKCFVGTDSTKLVEKDTKNVHDELDDPSSEVAYDKRLDRPNQTKSKVDFRKYRRIARANEYPYHVNALCSLAYNNYKIFIFT